VAYRLLALDLDGTVMESDLVIHERVLAGVAGLQARGVHVTIATGRMFAAALPFAERMGVRGPIICYQGALLRDTRTGEVLEHDTMPPAPAAEAVEVLLADDVFVIAYIDERLCIAERRPELDRYLRWHPEGAEVVVEPALARLVVERPPTKLLFVAEPPVVSAELEKLAPRFEGRLTTTRSHPLFGELTALGVSKGRALEALAARLGVPRAEVVAIGDQENDLSMIAWAGLGLAMGNAVPSVLAAADAVLPPVGEAGVAWAIETYFGRPPVL
jgi:Cof subfamily protein (haloacid dehalogenase superfamily)